MPTKRKIAICFLAIAGIVVAMATTPSVLPNHIRIAVRTEQGETRYSINEKTLNQQQLLSIVRKIGGFSKGSFDINVDQKTSFVEVARLVEAIKKEASESQYFLTYTDSTNRIRVFYDARVMPELMTHAISVYQVDEGVGRIASSNATAAAEVAGNIAEATARQLAIDQYNQLFKDKFISVDEEHHQFPQLDAKFFHVAEIKHGCWELAGDPSAGWYVYAKVSLDGKLVQLTRVGFSPE